MPAGELQRKAEDLSRSQFVGGRVGSFEKDGRLLFIALVRRGLTPDSHVIDVGCGALRAGYWLIHFLDPGHYHGIEPARERVDAARAALLEPGVEASRRPEFAYDDDFDLSAFGIAPDFVLARSIWSHAAKRHIVAMLESFREVAAPGALLLASYHPVERRSLGSAIRRHLRVPRARLLELLDRQRTDGVTTTALSEARARRRARSARQRAAGYGGVRTLPDYQGDSWVTGDRGQVAHRFDFIEAQCHRLGLTVRETREDGFGTQVWLEIRQASSQASPARVDAARTTATSPPSPATDGGSRSVPVPVVRDPGLRPSMSGPRPWSEPRSHGWPEAWPSRSWASSDPG